MYLSQKQIKDYQNFGVIIVKNIFNEWIEPLRKGFQKVLDKPSKHGRENVTDDNGRFFEDYYHLNLIMMALFQLLQHVSKRMKFLCMDI